MENSRYAGWYEKVMQPRCEVLRIDDDERDDVGNLGSESLNSGVVTGEFYYVTILLVRNNVKIY